MQGQQPDRAGTVHGRRDEPVVDHPVAEPGAGPCAPAHQGTQHHLGDLPAGPAAVGGIPQQGLTGGGDQLAAGPPVGGRLRPGGCRVGVSTVVVGTGTAVGTGLGSPAGRDRQRAQPPGPGGEVRAVGPHRGRHHRRVVHQAGCAAVDVGQGDRDAVAAHRKEIEQPAAGGQPGEPDAGPTQRGECSAGQFPGQRHPGQRSRGTRSRRVAAGRNTSTGGDAAGDLGKGQQVEQQPGVTEGDVGQAPARLRGGGEAGQQPTRRIDQGLVTEQFPAAREREQGRAGAGEPAERDGAAPHPRVAGQDLQRFATRRDVLERLVGGDPVPRLTGQHEQLGQEQRHAAGSAEQVRRKNLNLVEVGYRVPGEAEPAGRVVGAAIPGRQQVVGDPAGDVQELGAVHRPGPAARYRQPARRHPWRAGLDTGGAVVIRTVRDGQRRLGAVAGRLHAGGEHREMPVEVEGVDRGHPIVQPLPGRALEVPGNLPSRRGEGGRRRRP